MGTSSAALGRRGRRLPAGLRPAPVTRQNPRLELPSRVFDTDQADQAEDLARRTDSVVYTWKTAAGRNWLEQGLQTTDALALTILSPGLPREIDLAEAQPSPEDDDWTGRIPQTSLDSWSFFR